MYKEALKKGKTSKEAENFKQFRKSNKLHTSYHKYLNNQLDPEKVTTSKTFWKYIKSRKQDTMSIGTLKAEDKLAETPNDKHPICICVYQRELPSNCRQGPISINHLNIQITDKGVKKHEKCIEHLNEKKASGPDKIPIIFLKETAESITPRLSYTF